MSANYNPWGATVGGPVIVPKVFNGKNKVFFFLAYEGINLKIPQSSFVTVPAAAERGGDFSTLLRLGAVSWVRLDFNLNDRHKLFYNFRHNHRLLQGGRTFANDATSTILDQVNPGRHDQTHDGSEPVSFGLAVGARGADCGRKAI